MTPIAAYKKIKSLGAPVFRTNIAAVALGISNKYACKILKQLSDEKLILHLRRDLWALAESVDPFMLPDYLTAPMPSYISLQSALYYHGFISQIPSVIYAVSIARTRRYQTPAGVYSIHHITPELFLDFDIITDHEIRMAQPQKALFDIFYLKSSKSKLFYTLPEVEIPQNFAWHKMSSYIERIVNKSRRTMILNMLAKFKFDHDA